MPELPEVETVTRGLRRAILGRRIVSVTLGKTDFIDAPAALLEHLGMTGQIAPMPSAQPREKHTHVCLLLDDGRELRYTDARRFGRIAYLTEAPLAEELTRFGADPLEVSKEEFV